MELSIDTSTEVASIALSHTGIIRAEFTWHVGLNHTTQLMPAISRMFDSCHTSLSKTDSVFVALGPGSFAGVRVALAAAKGLAISLRAPLVGVSTLEIDAYPFTATEIPVCPIHDIGRGELAAARFQEVCGEWRTLSSENLTTLDQVCAETREKTIFCGKLSSGIIEGLRLSLGRNAIIPGPAARIRRAGFLSALGWARLQRGQADDPATLQPIYMRHPHISVPKNPGQPV